MKAIVLLGALCMLPFFTYSQKDNSKGQASLKKVKHSKMSYVYVKPFYGPPKRVYITKKHKAPPSWAPANGYKHRNIYFPEYKCYYDTYTGIYTYRSGERWSRTFSPPALMINQDLKLAEKVELDLDVEEPQVYFEQHTALYSRIP